MELEERILAMMDALLDYSRGTLWIVDDELWNRIIQGFVRKRKFHPALSLAREKITSLQDTIPMLKGSKSQKVGFQVAHVLDDNGSVSYFAIKPYRLPIMETLGHEPWMRVNDHKKRLDEVEMKKLERYLRNRGVNL